MGLESWPFSDGASQSEVAHVLLHQGSVNKADLIAVTHLEAGGHVVPVELYRNECGTVAARCHLGDDAPIIDGPSEDEVLRAVADCLEGLLLARESPAA